MVPKDRFFFLPAERRALLLTLLRWRHANVLGPRLTHKIGNRHPIPPIPRPRNFLRRVEVYLWKDFFSFCHSREKEKKVDLHFWRRSNFLGHFLPSPLWCLLIMRNFRRKPRPQVALQSLQGLQAVTTQSTGGVTALDEAIIIMSFICRCLSSSINRRLRSCQLSCRLAMYWLYWR